MAPFGIKYTVDHQPKNRGKFSILWARIGKKNRLSPEDLLHLLGSKSKIRITLIIGQKSGENASYYSCFLKKIEWSCVFVAPFGIRITLGYQTKKWTNQNHTFIIGEKMIGNA